MSIAAGAGSRRTKSTGQFSGNCNLEYRPGRFWILKVIAVLALGCGSATAQPAFPLHTGGPYIVDSNGQRVRLNAVNWYGAESTDFVVGGLQLASLQSIVQQIKNLGFNAVRIPWSNQLYESNPIVGSYALAANPGMEGENALTILDQVVNALTTAGIMVILDNHNSNAEWCCGDDGNTLWYNNQYPQTSWIADWTGMVTRYKSNAWVIGADLRNEPRVNATWGGNSATDWQAAAELGGNAVLAVNPNLLIFVEGVNYALDLSGASSLPVQLNVANQLVYEAHDYGFDYSGLTSYSDYVSNITPRWGYLVTGSSPQPLWVGEFGTCNTASTCVSSGSSSDNGYWFGFLTTYLQTYNVDWSYWPINGTQSTGSSRTYGAPELYGVLNPSWNGSALAALTSRLSSLMNTAGPSYSLTPGGNVSIAAPGLGGSSSVTVTPQNGFTGTVNLACSVSGGPSGAVYPPTCVVPTSVDIAGSSAVSATVSIATTGPGGSGSTRASPPWNDWRAAAATVLACVLLTGISLRRRTLVLPLLLMVAAGFSLSGCSSSNSRSATPMTTAGSYTVTVSATSAGMNPAMTQISVSVQ